MISAVLTVLLTLSAMAYGVMTMRLAAPEEDQASK